MRMRIGPTIRVCCTILISSCIAFMFCNHAADMVRLKHFVTPIIQARIKSIQRSLVTSTGKNLICPNLRARLGNHMFIYASTYGIAKRHNFTILLPENTAILQYFNITSVMVIPDRHACSLYFDFVLEKRACCTHDETLMDLQRDRNYVVGDWLQSWKYFQYEFDDIRQQFTFNKDIKETADYIVDNLRHSGLDVKTVVGIHVRIGDVLTLDIVIQEGYKVAPASYIHHAIDFFLKRYKNVVFIVCSDTMNHARQLIGDRNIDVHFYTFSPVHDMALLATCDHVIMTVGTFGWWAGFLSRGTVVYYKYPYRNNSATWYSHKFEDYFLPDWIGLD